MTNQTIPEIMSRIKSATVQSPIAVFKPNTIDVFRQQKVPDFHHAPKLDAVFADTCATHKLINNGDINLIGVYHSGMNMLKVEQELISKSTNCQSNIADSSE